ncbi:MAG: hypothetical protein LC098_04275 [Burkholderiales bacterium]|nr:hypothetical protein [Burkholderiales bacterium]
MYANHFARLACAAVVGASVAAAQEAPRLKLHLGMGSNDPNDCVASLPADGIQSGVNDPTGNLYAHGVTMEGSCANGGNVGVALNAPASTVANITTVVSWTADAIEQTCMYTAPLSSATGWPSGQVACQGEAACAGDHQLNVTMTAAGSYVFAVACTNTAGRKSVAMKPMTVY